MVRIGSKESLLSKIPVTLSCGSNVVSVPVPLFTGRFIFTGNYNGKKQEYDQNNTHNQVLIKKLQAGKPDSVGGLSFICSCSYLRDSSCLPCTLDEPPLKRYYMWHFSMQGLPAIDVTIKSRRLLPYVFTLPSPLLHLWRRDGVEVIFCGTICFLISQEPGYSPVHCSVLSGLSSS